MINACIYNSNGKLKGCITPGVIEQFRLQLNNLSNLDQQLVELFNEMFDISQTKYSADFLNILKFVLRKHEYDFKEQDIQKISRSYHNLVRYCCSNAVYEEVFEETISYLRQNGLQYRGKDIQGVENYECAFDYNGITIGIKMRYDNDLFNIWSENNDEIHSVVYFKDRKYLIFQESLQRTVLAIKACIEDCVEELNDDGNLNLNIIAEELLNIANILMRGK